MSEIRIITAGPLTTVQDLGRTGFQHMGMPAAGVMDPYAARIANILIGNEENAALLEATISGPEIEFLSANMVAVTGADMRPTLNGIQIPAWKACRVNAGDILKMAGAAKGLRAYIAIGGGIEVQPIMGSRSTYLKGGIGGHHGRALKPGDILKTYPLHPAAGQLPGEYIPAYGDSIVIRAVPGPHEEAFLESGLDSFFSQNYVVSSRSDRMGIFLEGEALALSGETTDILSSAILMGSIQVSSDGKPIVLMADRQTAGGYAQIATVITPDLWKLAQARPGSGVHFQRTDVAKAVEIFKAYENTIGRIKAQMAVGSAIKSVSYKNAIINGASYYTIIEEVIQ